jgi:hypothetical protein
MKYYLIIFLVIILAFGMSCAYKNKLSTITYEAHLYTRQYRPAFRPRHVYSNPYFI